MAVTPVVRRFDTTLASPPYSAPPQASTDPAEVSAAKAYPFLNLKVGELRMDCLLWELGCVDGWLEG
jgi:hypothetical protein